MKIGLEIHQQLNTGKLFCRCPSEIINEEPPVVVQRKFKAVFGELGKKDIAASFEEGAGKSVFYEFYPDRNCLVELDEEPPHGMNPKALETALRLARMLNMEILPEIHVMRKTVVDGSNTSGFQRTALVASGGFLETSQGKVGIDTLCVEEESARKTKEEGSNVYYRLDRLGIPLIEIATKPDMKTPEHARETALKLGSLLRTLDVRRGLGTIRQDINVSIPKGSRVEIKGVQDVRNIPKIIRNEVKRQKNLVDVSEILKKRAQKLECKIVEITDIVLKSSSNLRKLLGKAFAVRLEGFNGLIKRGKELRIGRDFSDIAKKFGLNGVVHSDELPGYGFVAQDVGRISKKLCCKKDDAFAFIISEEPSALEFICFRASQYLQGVPKDVRRLNPDCTTSYLRPLPGKSRMYPETDLFPIAVGSKMLNFSIPEMPDESMLRYEKMGLGRELAGQIVSSRKKSLFDEMSSKFDLKPSVVASALLSAESTIHKKYGSKFEISKKDYEKLFGLLEKDMIPKSQIPDALHSILSGDKVVTKKEMPESSLKKVIREVIRENKGITETSKLVGFVLIKTKNQASPKKVVQLLKKMLK